jgi:hypothetical protein
MTKTLLQTVRIFSLAPVILVASTQLPAQSGGTSNPSSQAAAGQRSLEAALFQRVIEDIVRSKHAAKSAKTDKDRDAANDEARRRVVADLDPYIIFASGASLKAAFGSALQEWRTDVQTGTSSPSSPGSTSLVSKGSVPSLLGLAVENGALTQTTSGTSITFRTNPTGLIKALAKQGYTASGPDTDQDIVARFLRKASAAVTFNTGSSSTSGTSQGSQAGTFTGSTKQISSFEFRYDIINRRDPRDSRYTHIWKELRNNQQTSVAAKVHEFSDLLKGIKPPDEQRAKKYAGWLGDAQNRIDAADADVDATASNSVQSVVLKIADDFVKQFGDDPGLKDAATAAGQAFSEYLTTRGKIRDQISKSPIVTLDYIGTRQGTASTAAAMASSGAAPATPGTKLPDLSNIKLIIAGGTIGGATLTANASLTLFDSNPQPPDKGRIRDFQLSGQADIPLREIGNIGVPTLTFSGLFLSLRRQPLGMPVQVNGVNVNLKGNIGFAQAKVSFPVKKGSGVNIPLSITYASRTDLNKEHDIRGSLGMTLDLDSVFANMKP